MELITRRIIAEIEGDPNKNLDKYATTGSPEYNMMVQKIAEKFGLDSLKFSTLEDLIEAIGLPKCKVLHISNIKVNNRHGRLRYEVCHACCWSERRRNTHISR